MLTARLAREQLWRLIHGLHPVTNEPFPEPGALADAATLRALVLAYEELSRGSPKLHDSKDENGRAGKPWTAAEDKELTAAFKAGATLQTLASSHQRREGAIVARVVHLKLARSRDDARELFRAR